MDSDSIAAAKAAVHEVKIDMPPDPQPQGYDRLASFMGFLPETAIFHRFAALNARNILYLQAELLWLDKQLSHVAEDDARSASELRQDYSNNWYHLSHTGEDSDGDSQQWKIFMKIRKALNEYSAYLGLSMRAGTVMLTQNVKTQLSYSREK